MKRAHPHLLALPCPASLENPNPNPNPNLLLMAPGELDLPSPRRLGPVLPQRRPSAARPLAPCARKTRDLPDLCVCHCCGLRLPDSGGKLALLALKSQWRVLLLCATCHRGIRSGALCSYCLSGFSDGEAAEGEEGSSLVCLRCRCRVHLHCRPRLRGFSVPTDSNPDSFMCVDCSAVPSSLKVRVACPSTAAKVGASMEDVVKNANYIAAEKEEEASRAKEKAMHKALVARHATDLARGALDVALGSKGSGSDLGPDLADEQLAFQLHRVINGSQRISRSQCSGTSRCGTDLTKNRNCGDPSSTHKSQDSCKVQTCVENKCFGTLNTGAADTPSGNPEVQVESPSYLTSFVVGISKKTDERSICNLDEDVGNAEVVSCSERVAGSAVGDNAVESITLPLGRSNSSADEFGLSSGGAEGRVTVDPCAAHLQTALDIRDRYLKKYFRNFRVRRYGKQYHRNSRPDKHAGKIERGGSVSVFLSCQSVSSSNSSTGILDDRPQFLTAAPSASANPKRLPSCQL